jgi:hypothetical protein
VTVTIPADLAHRLASIFEAHFTHDAGKQRTIEEALPLLRGEQTYGEQQTNGEHHPSTEQSAGAKGAT